MTRSRLRQLNKRGAANYALKTDKNSLIRPLKAAKALSSTFWKAGEVIQIGASKDPWRLSMHWPWLNKIRAIDNWTWMEIVTNRYLDDCPGNANWTLRIYKMSPCWSSRTEQETEVEGGSVGGVVVLCSKCVWFHCGLVYCWARHVTQDPNQTVYEWINVSTFVGVIGWKRLMCNDFSVVSMTRKADSSWGAEDE